MKIKTYHDMTITILEQTLGASKNMKFACDLTQKKTESPTDNPLSIKSALFLIDAKHTSVFEHGSMTFLASGISRSLLAQVTRQRHFSFTSASQHYQDYRDYPMAIRPGWDKTAITGQIYETVLNHSLNAYIELISFGELPEEARQVLPNACTVNLMITANPRALAEFLVQRLCKRNTQEMQVFAHKLHTICIQWIPEIFQNIGPHCFMEGKCNQGKMACKK